MTTAEAAVLAVTAIGAVAAILQIRRERLRDERARPRVNITVRKPVVIDKQYEPLMGDQLHLVADFRAVTDLAIVETWLVAGEPERAADKRHKGRNGQGGSGMARMKAGGVEQRRWPLVYARELPAAKPWRVCWQDAAEEYPDCVRVPDAYRELLTTAATAAEQFAVGAERGRS